MNCKPFLLLLLIAVIFSCRKSEYVATKPAQTQQRFFFTHSPSHSAVKALHASLLRNEEKKPFVDDFVKYGGYPLWDKAIVLSGATTRGGGGEELVLIPFEKDTSNFIGAIMAAKINGTDTSIKLMYHWEYQNFPYQNNLSDTGRVTAEKGALIFMGFQYLAYQDTSFNVQDSLLFQAFGNRGNKKTIGLQSFDNTIMNYEPVGQVCFAQYDGVGGWNTGCPPNDPNCQNPITGWACFTVWDWVDYDWGTPWGPIGTTGGGGSGGGSGGPWNNPCRIDEVTGTNPCNGPTGWLPVVDYAPVILTSVDYSTITDPCLIAVIAAIGQQGHQSAILKTYNQQQYTPSTPHRYRVKYLRVTGLTNSSGQAIPATTLHVFYLMAQMKLQSNSIQTSFRALQKSG